MAMATSSYPRRRRATVSSSIKQQPQCLLCSRLGRATMTPASLSVAGCFRRGQISCRLPSHGRWRRANQTMTRCCCRMQAPWPRSERRGRGPNKDITRRKRTEGIGSEQLLNSISSIVHLILVRKCVRCIAGSASRSCMLLARPEQTQESESKAALQRLSMMMIPRFMTAHQHLQLQWRRRQASEIVDKLKSKFSSVKFRWGPKQHHTSQKYQLNLIF